MSKVLIYKAGWTEPQRARLIDFDGRWYWAVYA